MMHYLWKYCVALAYTAVFMFTGCSDEGKPAAPGVLVSTQWLEDHLNDPDLVILHSGRPDLFDTLHIPGARLIIPVNFTVRTETRSNELPTKDSIVNLLRSVGVDDDSRIVLYYENSGLIRRTTRVYLTLDHLGLGQRTFVLNGGLPTWQEEGRETTDEAPDFSRGNLESVDTKQVIISAAEVDSLRWNPDIVVVDTRSDEEYYGTAESEEYYADGGHIEGAYFLSYLSMTSDDKPDMFKSDTELEELFNKVGMDPGKTTIFYCNSGIKATVCYLAALHLGYPALLYDGSFDEWEDLDLPFTGPVTLPEKKD